MDDFQGIDPTTPLTFDVVNSTENVTKIKRDMDQLKRQYSDTQNREALLKDESRSLKAEAKLLKLQAEKDEERHENLMEMKDRDFKKIIKQMRDEGDRTSDYWREQLQHEQRRRQKLEDEKADQLRIQQVQYIYGIVASHDYHIAPILSLFVFCQFLYFVIFCIVY